MCHCSLFYSRVGYPYNNNIHIIYQFVTLCLSSVHEHFQAPALDALLVEGKAISKIKPDEVQKELQEEHDLRQSLLPQASNVK